VTDKPLELGNLDSKRDWGFAGDYVEMMWLMLQQDTPDTYVIATGETHSIREFVEETGKVCGFDIEWQGKGEEETGIDKKTKKVLVRVNPLFYRPAEVEILLGNPHKARTKLCWKPNVCFKDLCKLMMNADINRKKVLSKENA
jgi:GDPmannose 4,6-dehydratase